MFEQYLSIGQNIISMGNEKLHICFGFVLKNKKGFVFLLADHNDLSVARA